MTKPPKEHKAPKEHKEAPKEHKAPKDKKDGNIITKVGVKTEKLGKWCAFLSRDHCAGYPTTTHHHHHHRLRSS
jgi:hypothetical protein